MRAEIRYSSHARRRQAQRGLTTRVANLVLQESDQEVPIGGGARAMWIGRARLRELQSEGIDAQTLEQVRNVLAVVSGDEPVVITLMRALRPRRARRYRRVFRRTPPARRRSRNRYRRFYHG